MGGFIGSGKVKTADYSSGASFGARKFRDLGNSSTFQYSFSETKQELRDFTDPAGGTDSSVTRIDVVSGQIDCRNISAANLALALWGDFNVLGTTAITGEAHVINAGAFIPTERMINTAVAPVVKKGATVVSTNDYVVSPGGITIAGTISTASVADGDSITIDYTPKASVDVQALINSAPNVSLFFEGVNGVDSKYALARLWKCKLGVAQNISMIGEDFATLTITFTVLKDDTITGAGLSKFLELEMES
jgi:hypothetical protein